LKVEESERGDLPKADIFKQQRVILQDFEQVIDPFNVALGRDLGPKSYNFKWEK
jgi:hypothetical protein